MDEKPNIAILILAAGESRRMIGKIKQVLPWGNSTLVENAIQQAKQSIATDVYLVLGSNSANIKNEIDHKEIICIEHKDWQKGMGSSIAAGYPFFSNPNKKYEAVLIMLADQPLMDTAFINEIIGIWVNSENTIVATQYLNRAGVPAIFDRIHFSDLQKLNHDEGAKHIIDKNDILVVDPGGKEVDIDTWEVYQKLFNSYT